MSNKYELLAIKAGRIEELMDEVHAIEHCAYNLKHISGELCCIKCKPYADDFHYNVFMKMHPFIRFVFKIHLMFYTIQDSFAYVWAWIIRKFKINK